MKGVKEGQHVTLMVGEEEHAARVEQIGEGWIVLGLARQPDEPLVPGAEATMESIDVRGLHRLTGTLDPDSREPDLVTLRWEEVEDIQRRQFVRVEATCIVEVRRQGRDPIPTFTVNVSGSGFLLAGPDDLEMGDQVELSVRLEEGKSLEVKGEVVRITGDGHRGVHISEIDEADRERLIHYVFERQRSAPRVRLQ
jgi:PilZ domain